MLRTILYARHHISVKVALYSADHERVLVMYYPRRDFYGLPGGHVDRGEAPDDAMARELHEELGVTAPNLIRSDFFRTSRIILGYTAVVPNNFETHPSNQKFEYAVWRTKEEISQMNTLSNGYQEFILKHWPVAQQA